MKFLGVIAIVLLSACCANSLRVTEYGSTEDDKYDPCRQLESKVVMLPAVDGHIQSKTIVFKPNTLYGVKHLNHNDANVQVTLTPAKFPIYNNSGQLKITITAPMGQGIESTFEAYGPYHGPRW